MVFSSAIFLFGFLPAFLMVYYAVPKHWRSAIILLGSYAFYGWWRIDYLALIFGMSLVSYYAGHVAASSKSANLKCWAVRLGVGFDLSVLLYFKYTMFLMSGLSDLSAALGGANITVPSIILPIGISFHTFQSISYIVDVARKDAPPARNVTDFLAFGALFPQLIAGPVLRYKDLATQFENRVHSAEKFMRGVARFTQGLAMKVLIADQVAPLSDHLFALQTPTLSEAWLAAAAFSIQLLFDFAGYSAMAIGLGLMVGFTFCENFDAPYISRSITEFWRRWHMSLSHWLRDYLYVPLGGNKRGRARTYVNLSLTMVLGGLWHGANWTFIIWGAWHGFWLAVERACGAKRKVSVWPRALAWPITICLVMIGWVMFRAPNVAAAFQVYAGMFGFNGISMSLQSLWQIQNSEIAALCIGGVLSCVWPHLRIRQLQPSFALQRATTLCLFAVASLTLVSQSHSPFLYFQF